MKDAIRDILAKHGRLPVAADTLADDADLHAAGLTSFGSVEVMMALEEEFGIEFPDRMLNRRNFASISAIAAAVQMVQTEAAA
ncbi:acyl carrier protein [Chenggangzhangella methanolivorans]|uniref:Acyl carrier protein n=1 Tax=Chenggangzhangella methanolivorans TaxID=1437009 RepID=A0A9E6UJ26_9HYPH|nr:acyl carrier protein [Chenggangzhangella methanolivorans]QZO01503.1 acyl carrier protein [Chenggangzhangella methanolivorans]